MGWEWISNYKSREIHGNNYRKMDLKENKPFTSSNAATQDSPEGGMWGQPWGRRQAAGQGAPLEVGTFPVLVTLRLGQGLRPDSDLHPHSIPTKPCLVPMHTAHTHTEFIHAQRHRPTLSRMCTHAPPSLIHTRKTQSHLCAPTPLPSTPPRHKHTRSTHIPPVCTWTTRSRVCTHTHAVTSPPSAGQHSTPRSVLHTTLPGKRPWGTSVGCWAA